MSEFDEWKEMHEMSIKFESESMSKRDYFALHIFSAMITSPEYHAKPHVRAVIEADKLIRELGPSLPEKCGREWPED